MSLEMAGTALTLRSLCRSWRCCDIQLVPQLPASCRAFQGSRLSNAQKSRCLGKTLSCQSGVLAREQQHRVSALSTLTKVTNDPDSIGNSETEEVEFDAIAVSSISSVSGSSRSAVKLQLQQEKPLRVERLLANLGYGKRQECAVLLKRKRVVYAATGKPAKVGEKALACDLLLDGEPLDPPPPMSIMLHKPVGYVVTSPDDENISDPKIYDLLPYRFGRRRPFMSAIGRLDKETSGLLLLTDDGKLLHSIQSPARGIWKLYTAELAAPLVGKEAAVAVRKFGSGTMMLQGDRSPLLPAGLRMRTDTTAEVAICEGRYHQIRRMFASIGHEVVRLHRHAIGGLSLPELDLPEGEWRYATIEDMAKVLSGPDMAESITQQQPQQPDHQDSKQHQQQGSLTAGTSTEQCSNGLSSSYSSGPSRGSRVAVMPDQQPAAAADLPAAAWYAASSSSSSSEEDITASEDDVEDDYQILKEEGQAVRRHKQVLKRAKRRAAVARGVRSVRWQSEEAVE